MTHVLALSPLAVLAWDFARGDLGANPIREVQFRTGKYTLVLLVLTLSCTPLSMLPGLKWVARFRRSLGLYAFAYAGLHFLNFIGLDYGFNLRLLREDIFEKRYAFVGLAAFLSLLPLAVTSGSGWARRLGKKREQLHRLIYLAAILTIVHFAWQDKAKTVEPLVYGGVVAGLLLVRVVGWVRRAARGTGSQTSSKEP